METIFDHNPTPDELRYLGDGDAHAYRVSYDTALADLAMLFAMRGDGDRSDSYIRKISDPELRFDFLYQDLIPVNRSVNRVSSTIDNTSKAA